MHFSVTEIGHNIGIHFITPISTKLNHGLNLETNFLPLDIIIPKFHRPVLVFACVLTFL